MSKREKAYKSSLRIVGQLLEVAYSISRLLWPRRLGLAIAASFTSALNWSAGNADASKAALESGALGDGGLGTALVGMVEDVRSTDRLAHLFLSHSGVRVLRAGRSIGLAGRQPAADACEGYRAVEPNGSPFHEVEFVGAPRYFKDGALTRPTGLTNTPIDYDPPLRKPQSW